MHLKQSLNLKEIGNTGGQSEARFFVSSHFVLKTLTGTDRENLLKLISGDDPSNSKTNGSLLDHIRRASAELPKGDAEERCCSDGVAAKSSGGVAARGDAEEKGVCASDLRDTSRRTTGARSDVLEPADTDASSEGQGERSAVGLRGLRVFVSLKNKFKRRGHESPQQRGWGTAFSEAANTTLLGLPIGLLEHDGFTWVVQRNVKLDGVFAQAPTFPEELDFDLKGREARSSKVQRPVFNRTTTSL